MNTLPKVLLMALLPTIASAEVVTDGSMTDGAVTTLSGSDMQITADLGRQQGTNLFHSFSQFNIANGESATFSGPAEIANIISRITGGDASTIDGLLRSDIAGANLFLLNPAGVMFGANASLDISGSLHVSSADYLVMENMMQFLVTPLEGEVLSTAAPAAFGFLGSSAGNIQLQGANLILTEGKTLSLVASEITLDNAVVAVEQGEVSMTAMGQAGEVVIGSGELLSGDIPVAGNIAILNQSEISVDGEGGGNIVLRSQQLTLQDSELSALTEGALAGQGVDIAVEDLNFIRSRIDTGTENSGNAGDITLQAHRMLFNVVDATGSQAYGFFSESNVPLFTVLLDIDHTWDEDLTARLRNPNNTEVILFSGVGGDGENFSQTLFDDNAAQSINAGSAPFSGSSGYRPQEALSTFVGENPEGTWTLYLEDTASGDGGNLNQWRLNIGAKTFNSTNVPIDIDSEAPNSIQSDLQVTGNFDPDADLGRGGDITMTANFLTILGDPQLSAAAESANQEGALNINIASIRQYGRQATFVDEGLGRGSFVADTASGTIIFDGSLGAGQALTLAPDQQGVYGIDHSFGDIRGNNLFHSFSDFNVLEGFSAVYLGPATVDNIISRVTGGDQSFINGTLKSDIEGANLFLLNPAGVMFGPNAILDLSGSLYISSADYLKFNDTGRFYTNLTARPNLIDQLDLSDMAAAPVAFGFLEGNLGNIQLQGANLILTSDKTLTLSANGIELNNAEVKIGQVQLTSLAAAGEVFVNTGEASAAATLAGLTMNGSAISGADSVNIRADNIELYNDSFIDTSTKDTDDAGDITIQASEIEMRGGSYIDAGSDGEGDGGNIYIETHRLLLSDNAAIENNARDQGAGGQIIIQAREVVMRDESDIDSESFGDGNAGGIDLTTDSLRMFDGAEIETNTHGSGDAGLIEIEADHVLIDGNGASSSTGIFGNAETGSSGDGGFIEINARSIELLDGGRISGSISGAGDGGTIAVVADRLLIDRMDGDNATGIFSQAGSDSSGNAGGISVSARSIELLDGGRISGSISGAGDGGTIAVVADRLLIDRMDGDDATGIFSQAGSDSSGNAGGISVSARSIELLDGGRISGSISGVGDGGTIAVVADQLLIDRMDGDDATGIFSSAGSSSTGGKGGQISVEVQALELRNGGIIQAATFSTGNGGLIEIEADQVLIDGNGSSSSTGIVGNAATSSSGAAGVLLINAQSIELLNGGEIESNTRGSGDAGSITVKADRLLIDSMNGNDKTGIFSSSENASTGNAGSIAVEARELQVQGSDSLIDTSTEASGNAGNIEVDSGTLVLADGGSIFSESTGTGRAGSISINAAGDVTINNGSSINTETISGFDPANPASIELVAGDLLLDGGSTITTNANGTANAGNIDLNVGKTIKLLANSSLSTESTRGGGGQINVIVNDLLYLKDSAVTTKVEQGGNQGDGGDIFVDPIFIVLDNSVITANAIDGNGGNITLIGDYINQSTDSQITASSQLGVDGEITIDALDAQVDAGEDSLSADLLDASQWQRQACAQRSGSDVSSFIVSQRPLRPSPHDDWSVSREL